MMEEKGTTLLRDKQFITKEGSMKGKGKFKTEERRR